MGWDGSGNVVRTNGTNTGTTVWQDDRDADIRIRADLHDTHDQDLADAIERCLNLDGENSMAADLDMGGYKLSNAGAATAGDDFPTYSQAQRQEMSAAQASGTDALSASFTPAITNLADKLTLYVRAAAQNTSATPTFSPNGLSAKTIVKEGNEPLLAGDIAGAAHVLVLQYHLSNDVWELLNPATMSVFFPNVDAAVTATEDELNVLDGITVSTSQLNSSGILNNFSATSIPTVNDDTGAGYSIGSRWIDTTNGNEWTCVDASSGAAVWEYSSAEGLADQRSDAPPILGFFSGENVQSFTSSGNFSVPNDVSRIAIWAGAGGGGGGGNNDGSEAAGGGGAGAQTMTFAEVDPGETVSVTVGSGGSGGGQTSGGADGGDTVVSGNNFTITIPGGAGGEGGYNTSNASSDGDGGAGGSVALSFGFMAWSGYDGEDADPGNSLSGAGGDAVLDMGMGGAAVEGPGAGANDATGYCAGGSGAYGAASGGDGAPGYVVIAY